jgi:hypothetical protein
MARCYWDTLGEHHGKPEKHDENKNTFKSHPHNPYPFPKEK